MNIACSALVERNSISKDINLIHAKSMKFLSIEGISEVINSNKYKAKVVSIYWLMQ